LINHFIIDLGMVPALNALKKHYLCLLSLTFKATNKANTIYYSLENLELPIIKEQIKEIQAENKILHKNEHIRDSTPQTSNQTKIEITNSNDLNTTEFLTKTNAKTNDLLIAEHITNSANIISKTTLGSNDLKTIDTPQKPLKRQIKRVLKTIGNNDDSEDEPKIKK
jgi:hypothetical protein